VRFLVDMCVDIRVAKWLCEQGHDAVHLRDEDLYRLPNREIYRKAIDEDRIVLTFGLDFSEISALSEGQKTSTVVLRLHNTRVSQVIERLSVVLPDAAATLAQGAIVVVEESRYRVRHFPIGT
jgi:predicted nuclease of predicted toxin-antitoxin system